MSRLFPVAEYAEDQALAKTILTTHVLYRGFQTGGVAGLGTGAIAYVSRRSRYRSQLRSSPSPANISAAMGKTMLASAPQTLLRHAGVGAVYGTVLSGFGMLVRMRGRDEIEWQDRSWRLLQNQGQLETDDWSLGGAGVGLVSSFTQSNVALRQVIGRTVVGSIAGIVVYLGYRYGFMKGQRDEVRS